MIANWRKKEMLDLEVKSMNIATLKKQFNQEELRYLLERNKRSRLARRIERILNECY